jgi:hypothetical protein
MNKILPQELLKLFLICRDIVATDEYRVQLQKQYDFLEACERWEQVRGKLPDDMALMRAKLYALDTGDLKEMYLELGKQWDKRFAPKQIPWPVRVYIANHFERARRRDKNWGRD